MARAALGVGAAAVPPACALAYALRGGAGAASAAIALGIAVANFAAAGVASAVAGRRAPMLAAFLGLPSYTLRMAVVLASLAALRGRSFIDAPTFALVFGAGVAAILACGCVLWARTPWLALTLREER